MNSKEVEVKGWKDLFDQVNIDDRYVPYSDIEYYAEQICNLDDGVDYAQAKDLAEKLYELEKNEWGNLLEGLRVVGEGRDRTDLFIRHVTYRAHQELVRIRALLDNLVNPQT